MQLCCLVHESIKKIYFKNDAAQSYTANGTLLKYLWIILAFFTLYPPLICGENSSVLALERENSETPRCPCKENFSAFWTSKPSFIYLFIFPKDQNTVWKSCEDPRRRLVNDVKTLIFSLSRRGVAPQIRRIFLKCRQMYSAPAVEMWIRVGGGVGGR